MSDRTLAAVGVVAMAGAGVIAGSLAWEWHRTGVPSILTGGIRAMAVVDIARRRPQDTVAEHTRPAIAQDPNTAQASESPPETAR